MIDWDLFPIDVWDLILGGLTLAAVVGLHFLRRYPRAPATMSLSMEFEEGGSGIVATFVNRGEKPATGFELEWEPEEMKCQRLDIAVPVEIHPGEKTRYRFYWRGIESPVLRWRYRSGKRGRRSEGEWNPPA